MYTIATRIKIALRAPNFYFGNLLRRFFKINDAWKRRSRGDFSIGSWQWLALSEIKYGGHRLGVATSKHRGGDRMSPFDGHACHGYGFSYADFLAPLMARRMERFTLLEVGILNGSGLAIWCDLFPNARVVGLDLDLSNFCANRSHLESAGAFTENKPEVYEFNQLDPNFATSVLCDVLGDNKIDIAIDDGCHSMESIRITFDSIRPHLNKQFVYFIEDNFDTYDDLASKHKNYRWYQRGEMVIVQNL
jgi:hypothetical protein